MKRAIIAVAGLVLISAISLPTEASAYSYGRVRWPSATPYVTVSVDYGSIPSQWSGPFTYAMGAWNNAGSKLRFTAYSGGSHVVSLKYQWFASYLAQTTTVSYGSSIYDCDIVFNSKYSWDVNGAANKYDAWEVMTHELGHWLLLNDLYGAADQEKTMYGHADTGETKQRSLTADDINGIRYIYGVR